MKKEEGRGRLKAVVLTVAATLFVLFVLLPVSFSLAGKSTRGNVALIPISGTLTVDGDSLIGHSSSSSQDIIELLQEAEENTQIKVIVLDINSPGGSAVAADEISSAVKRSTKPIISVIHETGASGAYWIASATKHIIANRMSITGSIGVISSYLEFTGLMEKYGVSYERLVAGKYKDMGSPFRELDKEERLLLEKKLEKIHGFFVEEVAANRNLPPAAVEKLATGEFYLGYEALKLGLVDELGDLDTAEAYLQNTQSLEKVVWVPYQKESGLFELLSRVATSFSFHLGQGIGSLLVHHDPQLLLL